MSHWAPTLIEIWTALSSSTVVWKLVRWLWIRVLAPKASKALQQHIESFEHEQKQLEAANGDPLGPRNRELTVTEQAIQHELTLMRGERDAALRRVAVLEAEIAERAGLETDLALTKAALTTANAEAELYKNRCAELEEENREILSGHTYQRDTKPTPLVPVYFQGSVLELDDRTTGRPDPIKDIVTPRPGGLPPLLRPRKKT